MTWLTAFFTDKDRPWRHDMASLLLIFGIAFFQFLGRIPLLDPDEGRYAEIPREMIERGDFVTPYLNYVKYFEKPPLHYWLNAISFAVFGQNEFAARVPGALMGLVTVLFVYHAGRRLFGRREGLLAALMLGTATGFLVQARIDLTDMTLTCCMTVCLGSFVLATVSDRVAKGRYYYLMYVAAALAVLAKGLIGIVLPGGVIFCHLLLSGRWSLLKEVRLPTGIPLFLLVAAPWFVAVSLRNPEFARFFFIHEHFERFLTKVHGRYQPIWFFIPVLAGTMLPWSFFVPASWKGIWSERATPEGTTRLYLLIWSVVIFAFFSKSNSKLVPYILPVFPPLTLLMGCWYARAAETLSRPLKIQGYAVAVVFILLGIGCIGYPHVVKRPDVSALGGAIIGLLFLGEGVLALRHTSRGKTVPLLLGLIVCSYAVGIVAPPIILKGIADKKSLKELGVIAKAQAGKDTVIASFGLLQGLPFYTERRVVIVGNVGEAEFGSKQGDQSAWFLDHAAFGRLWNSPVHVLVVLGEWEQEKLWALSTSPPKILAGKGRRVLASNH